MKRYFSLYKVVILFQILLLTLTFFSGQGAAAQENNVADVSQITLEDASHNPATILARYAETLDLMGESEGGASLRLYNDGYVHVYYPAYMKRAGNYGGYLEQAALDKLYGLLTRKIILEFDKQIIHNQLHAMRPSQDGSELILTKITDTSNIVLEIFPNRYQSIGFGFGGVNESKYITWSNLKWDARHFSEIEALQSLAIIQQRLLDVMARSDFQRLD